MIGGLRVWWGASAVVVGMGAALLVGTGVASAETGVSGHPGRTGTSEESNQSSAAKSLKSTKSTKSATLSTKIATAKRRLATAAAESSVRASRLKVPRSPQSVPVASGDTADSTITKPKSNARDWHSRLTVEVAQVVSKLNANTVTANLFHPPRSEPKNTTPSTATADVTPALAGTVGEPPQPASAPVAAIDRLASLKPPTQVSLTVRVTQLVTALRSLAAPVANAPPAPRPLATLVLNLLSSAGWTPRPAAVAAFPALAAWSAPTAVVAPASAALSDPATNGVTGVRVGHSDLTIPYGPNGYTTSADWYFPTQADGSVQATGVIWLQHGFLGDKSWYAALATELARQTNSVVVAPNIASFRPLFGGCSECTLNSVPLQQAAATMFLGDRAALNISANAAGFSGTLPETFILTGHSAGGGFATAVGGFTVDNGAAAGNLLGVVMFDGVSSNGTFAPAVASLDTLGIPVYQIAAPPQSWNANGQTTNELVTLHPTQFTGVVLNNGSHVDSFMGAVPIIDFIAQLFIRRSPPGNTEAVYTFATGWINDMYAGNGPSDPLYGLYGNPGQPIILGPAAAVVLGTPQAADVNA